MTFYEVQILRINRTFLDASNNMLCKYINIILNYLLNSIYFLVPKRFYER